MLLTETSFVLFFLPAFIVLHVAVTGATTADWMRGHVPLKGLNIFLLLGSLAYFSLLNPWLAGLLLVAAGFTWLAGLFIAGSPRSGSWLFIGLAGLAGLFFVARWMNATDLNVGILTLPLKGQPGKASALIAIVVSFFIPGAVGHLIDAARKKSAERDPVKALLSLLLFPFLLAGPIVKRSEMHDQVSKRIVSVANFAYGMRRFSIGWFKKIFIADIIGQVADTIFTLPPNQVAAARAWLGVICFGLQIYFAVSAYSDMALGLGRMFGFRLSENFKWPYVSRSLHEFWENWFFSLHQWMREYLRLPLGGGPLAPMVAAFVVAGAWYGSRWTFIVWAVYHLAFVLIERFGLAKLLALLPDPVRYVYVSLVVLVGWVFFRADTLPAALQYLSTMAGQNVPVASAYYLNRFLTPEIWVSLICGVIGAAPLVRAIGRWRVAIDGATTAIAVMIFALLVYIWRMFTSPFQHGRSAHKAG